MGRLRYLGLQPRASTSRGSKSLIDRAAWLGVETFTVDAGWFPRLGDWRTDAARFPGGLQAARRARARARDALRSLGRARRGGSRVGRCARPPRVDRARRRRSGLDGFRRRGPLPRGSARAGVDPRAGGSPRRGGLARLARARLHRDHGVRRARALAPGGRRVVGVHRGLLRRARRDPQEAPEARPRELLGRREPLRLRNGRAPRHVGHERPQRRFREPARGLRGHVPRAAALPRQVRRRRRHPGHVSLPLGASGRSPPPHGTDRGLDFGDGNGRDGSPSPCSSRIESSTATGRSPTSSARPAPAP